MKIKNYLLPDEWLSAAEASQDLWSVLSKTVHGLVKTLFSLLAPFILGSVFFYFVNLKLINLVSIINADFLRALLTVMAILTGFMITTILFTGKPNGLAALNSQELKDVRDKISYLVLSQCLTLISHIVTALFCLTCIAFFSFVRTLPLWAAVILAGLLLNSLMRSLILPLQIWEVHAFSLDVEISERIRVEQARVFDED